MMLRALRLGLRRTKWAPSLALIAYLTAANFAYAEPSPTLRTITAPTAPNV